MVTDSVVALIVRKGNPEGITGWDDLLREGVEVVNPNPFTSGGARWNVMAAYGAQLEQGKSEDEAVDYLRELYRARRRPGQECPRVAADVHGGKGDVLLGYENEAITAQQKGEEIDYVVPDETILIENPVAVVTESGNPELAQAFVDFLRDAGGAAGLRGEGIPPGRSGGARGRPTTRRPRTSSRSTISAAGTR